MSAPFRRRRNSRSFRSTIVTIGRGFASSCLSIFIVLTSGCAPSRVEPRIVADLPGYTEGIVFDAHGSAFVSALDVGSVHIINRRDAPAEWYRTNKPNGHKVLPDGTHLIAAEAGVHHVKSDGTLIQVLAPQLVRPNDLALDGDRGVYITVPQDSEAQRMARRSAVYYLDSARVLHRVADDFRYPNGIIVRPDGRSLLVNDSADDRIYEFQINSPGVLSGRRVFADISSSRTIPDGMTLDQAGRLYVAAYGRGVIMVFTTSGSLIREYPTGLKHPSNVAFGGDTLTDLYVTGSPGKQEGPGQLVVLPLNMPGRSSLSLPASIDRP